LLGFGALIVVLLGAFAYVVVTSESQSRRQAEQRFDAQAAISAQLTSSLFTQTAGGSQAAAAKAFGGRVVDRHALAAAKSSTVAFVEILDQDGKVIGASPGAPGGAAMANAAITQALKGQATLSDLLPATKPGGGYVLEWALPFQTPFGRRVEVEGLNPAAIFTFLNSYLGKAASNGGVAFVLDSRSRIVGVSETTFKPGELPKAAGLVAALSARPRGLYHYNGLERYFTTAPVQGSSWRVALTVPTNSLFPALAGSRSWLLYAVLAALGVAGVASLLFFRRALVNGVKLADANRELTTVNATLEERVAERTAAAEERARELARSNEELEQFSSVASHDLQEPLRKIRMFGDRLRQTLGETLAEEPAADLERMRSAAERMQRLINDLLDFSRVTHRGREFEPVNLDQIAEEVVADLEARVVELNARIDIGELPTIDADELQMRQLMQNLVGNALKFHRENEPPLVRIHAEVIAGQPPRFPGESTAGDRCVITVEDNGIGFDDKHAERVFAAFERLHARSAYDGTGIGLSIARKIVWRHGGHITATGVPDRGATFTVTLPLTQPNGRHGGTPQ
jgi:signal transduction histidine kinase